MPTPCVVSTASVNLTANGSPAQLQADVRISGASNRLVVAADGLRVPDHAFRIERGTNSAGILTGGAATLVGYDLTRYVSSSLTVANSGIDKTAGNTAGVTIPVGMDGVWRIGYGFLNDTSNTIGARSFMQLLVNGVAINTQTFTVVAGDSSISRSASVDWRFTAGDVLQTFYSNNDSAVRTIIASPFSFLSGSYQGPAL